MRQEIPFESRLTKNEMFLGLSYLGIHIFLLPVLLGMLSSYYPEMNTGTMNLIYYSVGVGFLGLCMMPFLKRHYDELLDHTARGLIAVPMGYLVNLGLTYLMTYFLMLVTQEMGTQTPNDALISDLTGREFNILKGLGIYIAPLLEETLFRGVLFGGLRQRSRTVAYVVTVILFSLYHVWQYAIAWMDVSMLLFAVQYVPVSFALCWSYERGGTLWSPIFLHMLINSLSFAAMQ
ncbi:MAG: type II CAAX endopeptidase family protein [Eubacteriales bacterium]|nr:type II CAAX endopeptidase family protein [Eubacteriales bacterium]